eukprot:scaffold73003_cov20-Tisochrysis_lutea.AAC.1
MQTRHPKQRSGSKDSCIRDIMKLHFKKHGSVKDVESRVEDAKYRHLNSGGCKLWAVGTQSEASAERCHLHGKHTAATVQELRHWHKLHKRMYQQEGSTCKTRPRHCDACGTWALARLELKSLDTQLTHTHIKLAYTQRDTAHRTRAPVCRWAAAAHART